MSDVEEIEHTEIVVEIETIRSTGGVSRNAFGAVVDFGAFAAFEN